MLNLAIRTRRALAIVVSATVLAGAVTASTGASAKPIFWPPIHHHHHWGFGPGALFGGLALGALAAGATEAEYGDCGIARRVVVDEYGNEYVRRVRVCD